MRKVCFVLVAVFSLFVLSTKSADASLLRFNRDGTLQWNVLGLNDSVDAAYESAMEVKKIADKVVSGGSIPVSISNEDGKVFLSYGADDSAPVDITGYESEIVEIEEKDAPRTISIAATPSGFAIKQRGITAETSYPINITSPENKLSLTTNSGERFLTILPYEAVNLIIKTNIISTVVGGQVTLVEKDEGEMAYVVRGEKHIVLFNVFAFQVPVNVEVSATSGTVLNIDQPLWYSVVDFLLV
jgi:hypothetical protein